MINENYKVVPVAHDEAITGDVTCDSINMKNYHKATFIFLFQSLATASCVMTVNSGASDGATTSAIYFNYAFASAAEPNASCDVLAAWTNAATLTITHGTYSDYMLVVEVDAAAMDTDNSEEWLTVLFTDPGTATGNITGFAILEPRYTGNVSGTALT
jgi:uncharacterized membrane protein